jgi:hypothetical protein
MIPILLGDNRGSIPIGVRAHYFPEKYIEECLINAELIILADILFLSVFL